MLEEIFANCMLVGLAIFIIGGFSITYLKEKKEWNKGKCSKCGCKMNLFGYNYEGDRIYKCDNRWCNHFCQVSYKKIDGGKKDEII